VQLSRRHSNQLTILIVTVAVNMALDSVYLATVLQIFISDLQFSVFYIVVHV
jgi:hypothetical protein